MPWAHGLFDEGPTTARVVLWLRQELRLRDNPLLQRAIELSEGEAMQIVVCASGGKIGFKSAPNGRSWLKMA